MNHTKRKNVPGISGFTLLEILLATIIGTFIAVTSVAALKTVVSGRDRINDYTAISAELRFAAELIRKDFANFYRDRSIQNVKLIGSSQTSAAYPSSRIIFDTVNRVKARPSMPEGDVFEVEYYLRYDADQQKILLLRRLWPNPNELNIPLGVATIIAENIILFDVRYYDGLQWTTDWPEELETLPALILVNLAAKSPQRNTVYRHDFLVNFSRWPNEGAVAQSNLTLEETTAQTGSE